MAIFLLLIKASRILRAQPLGEWGVAATKCGAGERLFPGITVVGAVSITAVAVKVGGKLGAVLGFLAIVFATINVIGGYMVTDRMLGMFKKKDDSKK